MNLYNLKIFTDTARLGSMTHAAQANSLSRPAVSQAIKKLEQELGVELLVHQPRLVQLTAAGVLLLKKATQLLAESHKIAHELRQVKGPVARDFKIGSSRTLATFNLPKILQGLGLAHPDASLHVRLANSGALVKKLKSGEIDLAFLIGDDSLEDTKETVVGRGHFVLVRPKKRKDLGLRYALTEKRPETERARVLFERSQGKPLPVFAEIHSWDAIWQAVNEGICGGLVPDFLLHSRPSKSTSLPTILISKVFPYEIKALHLRSKTDDPLIKSFIQAAKKS